MNLAHKRQTKNELNADIVRKLLSLKEKYFLGWRDISPLIGVSESQLSRIANEKKTGGRQLLAGLNLLLAVIKQNQKLKDYQVYEGAMRKLMGDQPMRGHEKPNSEKLSPGDQLVEETVDVLFEHVERARQRSASGAGRKQPSSTPKRTKRRTDSQTPSS